MALYGLLRGNHDSAGTSARGALCGDVTDFAKCLFNDRRLEWSTISLNATFSDRRQT